MSIILNVLIRHFIANKCWMVCQLKEFFSLSEIQEVNRERATEEKLLTADDSKFDRKDDRSNNCVFIYMGYFKAQWFPYCSC